MKKNLFKTMSVAAMAAFTLAACNNAAPKMDEQPAAVPQGGMKIAYVEVDSLASQYQFCIDYTKILEKKRTNATNTLNQKGQQLQAAMNNFQQKINNNQFRSREEAENAQLAIQPRTFEGSWWHKQIYPDQVWLDGIYMAHPFAALYEKYFPDSLQVGCYQQHPVC